MSFKYFHILLNFTFRKILRQLFLKHPYCQYQKKFIFYYLLVINLQRGLKKTISINICNINNDHYTIYINVKECAMNILIVKYLPSGDNSNTKKLYDYFLKNVKESDIHEFDLIHEPLPHFNYDSMNAYKNRNFMGEELTPEQEQIMKPFDEITKKVKKSDLLVFVFPMHNFSMPGIVKLFFDGFMLKGEVYDIVDNKLVPLLGNKKALVLYSHGGDYKPGTPQATRNYVKPLLMQEFGFMGIHEFKFISYATQNLSQVPYALEDAEKEIHNTLYNWSLLK